MIMAAKRRRLMHDPRLEQCPMKRFAALFAALDATTKTQGKVAALMDYFTTAPESDRVWTIALLSGRRPRRLVSTAELRLWASEIAGVPAWLFEESYAAVGDLAETIALLLPPATEAAEEPTLTGIMADLEALRPAPPNARRAAVLTLWATLPGDQRFLFNKLLTGGFRIGVSQGLMTRALARATGQDEATLAHRLMGNWTPATTEYAQLTGAGAPAGHTAQPYPFALATALDQPPTSLGQRAEWLAEWKWDGIRGQILQRPGLFALWSRGEELITDRFPEFQLLAATLPAGVAMDGEVLAWAPGAAAPLPFASLQTRIGRQKPGKSHIAAAPARFLAYDLLEEAGEDLRALPLSARRDRLARLIGGLPAGMPIALSAPVEAADWAGLADIRATARDSGAEGLMLKHHAAPYQGGRKRGAWWKWKLDPWSVDAVMIYAQAGHGRRAGLYSDFTFALRDGDALVPFTKAYSGLTDAEFEEITRWVNRNTLERFGPVRRVPPELVFEIAFEGIQASPRHKSGIALRFPRMVRWRRDKPVAEIDSLDSLRALLHSTVAQG